MHAHHVLRPFGETGDLIDVQRRGVAGQNGAGFHDCIEFLEDRFLHPYLFKHRLNHQIRLGYVVIAQGGGEQSHALVINVRFEFALGHLGFVIFTDGGDAPIQCLLLHLQHLHGDAGIEEIHGNAPAHGAGANDADVLNAHGSPFVRCAFDVNSDQHRTQSVLHHANN